MSKQLTPEERVCIDLDYIIKLIKDNLNEAEKEVLVEFLTRPKRKKKTKQCNYCGCPLMMDIEEENNCCWDCHFEGRDINQIQQQLSK
ncbi:MAG: hypothetical protein JST87_05360 [Bacteroidetes bacterium]|nr:hypothetical protein [Bacteroidota bacterium]